MPDRRSVGSFCRWAPGDDAGRCPVDFRISIARERWADDDTLVRRLTYTGRLRRSSERSPFVGRTNHPIALQQRFSEAEAADVIAAMAGEGVRERAIITALGSRMCEI